MQGLLWSQVREQLVPLGYMGNVPISLEPLQCKPGYLGCAVRIRLDQWNGPSAEEASSVGWSEGEMLPSKDSENI